MATLLYELLTIIYHLWCYGI